ncbi:MAG: bifunctional riboflavin kinase/FAD synthetase [Clostridia bacterium]|nr:bifunctional riboflavin kinase/FAD synthetase [Clostridia bacterium]
MKHFDPRRGTCVALGNFDGIHIGHERIIRSCVEAARESGSLSVVWSFRRHPQHILKGNFSTGNIISPSDKEEICRSLGADLLFLEDFETVRDLSPEAFCQKILLEKLNAKTVFCGFNFRFGKNGAGDANFLRDYLRAHGAEAVVADPVCLDGDTVSSSRIRNLLSEGSVRAAGRLLGRPYSICFPVLHGKHLGTRIGFPTLNQAFPEEYVVPRRGVYAVRMLLDGKAYPGVCNVGIRPTVDENGAVLAETHLFDFSADLYGRRVRVEFFEFLRPEKRFSSLEELCAQIQRDRKAAELYWEENQ